ncbi:MAG: DUF3105 domain-containing protein [Myxococcota bacterium]|nr:DUF3105 domain-containing protein [Myxococcota bacterium]
MRRHAFITVLAAVLGACSSTSVPIDGARVDEMTIHPDAPPIAPHTECSVYTAREPAASAEHRPVCSAIEYPVHPPASGAHYSQWAAFGTYDAPVPPGFLVHSLEHGAIVLAYRCDGGDCPEITSALAAIVSEHGEDPLCRGEASPSRFVIVPDPELEQPIAAIAWEHVYLATCLDLPSLRAFVDLHYGQAPEDLCAPGVDRSATGWCE